MANLTIYEFFGSPNAFGEVTWPADLITARATTDTHSLNQNTRVFLVCADADGRIQINANGVTTAASASSVNILLAVPNQFIIGPASGQTLKFA